MPRKATKAERAALARAANASTGPDWAARNLAISNLPELYELPVGVEIPGGADVDGLRRLYCRTAPTDAECSERVDRLMRVQDPIECLVIVAPHLVPEIAPRTLPGFGWLKGLPGGETLRRATEDEYNRSLADDGIVVVDGRACKVEE
jgi:hypothetical protein